MPNCFIFLQETLIEDNYLSAVLDDSTQLLEPLEKRTLEQLKTLQKETVTYLIFPAEFATLYHLSMPRQSPKKLNTALHFFLETKIPQHLGNVHISYDYDSVSQNYHIALVNKKIMREIYTHFNEHHISFDAIFIDASLLKPNEALYQESEQLLIYGTDYHGAIPKGFISLYESCFNHLDCYSPLPMVASWASLMTTTLIEEPSVLWLAKRAHAFPFLNLCQGEFIKKKTRVFPHAQQWAAYLALTWLLTFFLYQAVHLYRLNAYNHRLQTQITTAYKQLFPQARQVLNPRFQLSQYLKKTQTLSPLWQLIDTLGIAIMPLSTDILSLVYQNKVLSISVQAKDFKELEALELHLKKLKIKVHQTNANQQNKRVQSTLELSL